MAYGKGAGAGSAGTEADGSILSAARNVLKSIGEGLKPSGAIYATATPIKAYLGASLGEKIILTTAQRGPTTNYGSTAR